MNFLLEMLLTAILSLFFSFLVSKLVSLAMANDPTSNQAEEADMDGYVVKMNVPVLVNERSFQVVDQNVETVDRVDAVEAESMAAVSLEMIIAEDMIDEQTDLAGKTAAERVRTTEAVSTASVSMETVVEEEEVMIRELEEGSGCVEVENEESGVVVDAESEEVRVESSNAVEEKWSSGEEKEELVIEEEDDDWEGIERSELEEAFMAAANYLEESGKAEELGAEAKMELYGLHKIATEGSCRGAQPMAVMVSARAKWNAWQKLGNMNQEEAMEQYLALVSEEIPSYNVTSYFQEH